MSYVGVGPVNFLKVFVSDWLNNPIQGINVTVLNHGTNYQVTGMTQHDGYVSFQLSTGVYDIMATVSGHNLKATVYHDGTEPSVSLQLSATVLAVDFLVWNPLLLPNWFWIVVAIIVCIAVWYVFFRSA